MGDEDVIDYGDDGRDEADGNSDGRDNKYKEGDWNGAGVDDNIGDGCDNNGDHD